MAGEGSTYGELSVTVGANTAPLTQAVSKAAQSAGEQASSKIGAEVSKGLSSGEVQSAASKAGDDAGKTLAQHVSSGMAGLRSVAGNLVSGIADSFSVLSLAAAGYGVAALKTASQVQEMDTALGALARSNGLTTAAVEGTVGALEKQGIATGAAQNTVARFVQDNLQLADASKLAAVAQNAAAVSHQSVTATMNALTQAITSGRTAQLKANGLTVDATSAYKTYAAQQKIAVTNLTAQQKQQALLNAVLQQGTHLSGAYAAAMQQPYFVLEQMPTILENISENIGASLLQGIGPVITAAGKLAVAFEGAVGEGGALQPLFEMLGRSLTQLTTPLVQMITRWTAWLASLKPGQVTPIINEIEQLGPVIERVALAMAAVTGTQVIGRMWEIGPLFKTLIAPIGQVAELVGGSGLLGGLKLTTGGIGLLATAFTAILHLSPQLRTALGQVGTQLSGSLGKAFSGVMTAVKPLLPVLEQAGKQIGGALASMVTALGPTLTKGLSNLGPMITPLIGPIGKLVTAIGTTLVTAIQEAAPLLTTLANALGPVLGAALAVAGPLISAIATVLSGLGPAIVPVVVAFLGWKTAVNGAIGAMKGINGVLGSVKTGLTLPGEILNYLKTGLGAFTGLYKTIVTLPGAIKNVVTSSKLLQGVWSVMGKLGMTTPLGLAITLLIALGAAVYLAYEHFKPFRDAVDSLGDAFKTFGGMIVSTVATAFDAVLGAAKAALGWLKTNWPVVAGVLLAPIAGPIGIAVGLFIRFRTQITSTLSGAAGDVGHFLGGIGSDILGGLSAAVSSVGNVLGGIGSTIVGALEPVVSAVGSVFARIGQLLIDPFIYMTEFWTQTRAGQLVTRDVLKPIADAVTGFLSTEARGFERIGQAIFDGISDAVTAVGGVAAWIYKHVLSPIGGAFVSFATLEAKGAEVVGRAIFSGILAAVNAVGGAATWVYKHVIAPIGSAIGGAGAAIGHAMATAAAWVWRGFTQALGDVLTWIYEHVDVPVIDGLKAMGSGIFNAVKTAAGNVWKGFTSALGNVASWILRHVINPVIGGFAGFAGKLATQGAQAINGFLNGIVRNLKDIGAWIRNNIFDPIIHWITYWFKISSPSQVMAELGGHMIGGLMQGLVRGASKVPGFITDTFGSMPGALLAFVERGLIGFSHLSGEAMSALQGLAGDATGWVASAFTSVSHMFGDLFGGTSENISKGVAQWAGVVKQALAMVGRPDLLNVILAQMQTESGGNQYAVNNWDSNAAAGTPSKGLMQVIQPTFDAYAGALRSRGIFDPLANIYAAIRYALARYGARITQVLGHGHGYAAGGVISEPVVGIGTRTGERYDIAERGPEIVLPVTSDPGIRQHGAIAASGAAARPVTINVYPQQGQSETQIAAAVSRRLAWAAASGAL